MRERLERGDPVVPMFGPLGLAWLQRQAEIAEQLIHARGQSPYVGHAAACRRPTSRGARGGCSLERTFSSVDSPATSLGVYAMTARSSADNPLKRSASLLGVCDGIVALDVE
jgi:hypothetical protein